MAQVLLLNKRLPPQVKLITASISGPTTLIVGQNYTFTAIVNGADQKDCQFNWTYNGASIGTNSSVTITADSSHLGQNSLSVYVTYKKLATSASYNFTGITIPTLDDDLPADALVQYQHEATFSVSVLDTGYSTCSYQWYLDGSAVSGATNTSYKNNTAAIGAHTVYCKVTNGAGSVNSKTATFTVKQQSAVAVTISGTTTVNKGSTTTLTANVTGAAASQCSFVWKNGTTQIGTSQTYTYSATAVGSETLTVTVTYVGPSSTATDTASVTIKTIDKPTLDSTKPANASTTAGTAVTLSISVTSTNGASCTYQWYKGSTAISGATSTSYTIPATQAAGTYTYYCKVTNAAGSTNSRTATVTIYAALSATLASDLDDITVGDTVKLTATPSGGTGTYTYAWEIDGKSVTGTAATYSYSFTSSLAGGARVFKCTITSGSQTISKQKTVHCVKAPVLSSTAPADATIQCKRPTLSGCTWTTAGRTSDQTATLTPTISTAGYPTSYTYQWKKDGKNISGATSSSYTATVATLGANKTATNVYTCTITATHGNKSNSVTTRNITVTTKSCNWVAKCTSSKTITISGLNCTLIDVELIGGGGGGGCGARYVGGGGGAGSTRSRTAAQTFANGDYVVTIGAGGSGSSTADAYKSGSETIYTGTQGGTTSITGTGVSLSRTGGVGGKSAVGYNTSSGNTWSYGGAAVGSGVCLGASGGDYSSKKTAGTPGAGTTNYEGTTVCAGGGGGAALNYAYSKGIEGCSGDGGTPYSTSGTANAGGAGTANTGGGGGGGAGYSSTPGGKGGKGGSGIVCLRNAR